MGFGCIPKVVTVLYQYWWHKGSRVPVNGTLLSIKDNRISWHRLACFDSPANGGPNEIEPGVKRVSDISFPLLPSRRCASVVWLLMYRIANRPQFQANLSHSLHAGNNRCKPYADKRRLIKNQTNLDPSGEHTDMLTVNWGWILVPVFLFRCCCCCC